MPSVPYSLLIKDGLIKFHSRYVGDKIEGIDNSLILLIRFTIDRFENGIVHFGCIRINGCETDLYYRTTRTGHYCDFSSQRYWRLKIYWIKILRDCATKICSSSRLLNDQIKWIRIFMLQNRYPKFIRNSVMKCLQQKKTAIQKDDDRDVKSLDSLYR